MDEDNSNDSKVTCLSTHLTSFAVLVSVGDVPEKKVKSTVYNLRLQYVPLHREVAMHYR